MSNLWYNGRITPISPQTATVAAAPSRLLPVIRWIAPFIAAFLPIVFLGLFSYQVASQSVEGQVRAANASAVSNAAQTLTQDFLQTSNLVHAIAGVSGTVDAIRTRDDLAMRSRLRAVVLAYPQIDRVFLTDPDGTLWTDYPQAPQAFGLSQKNSLWYPGVVERGTTYISDVYVRPHDPAAPVVAFVTPVRDGSGSTIALLVFEYRTELVRRWLDSIKPGQNGDVFVLDGSNRIVAHSGVPDSAADRDAYTADPFMKTIREDMSFVHTDRIDPLSNERAVGSFQVVTFAGNAWVVAAQQPAKFAYAPLMDVRWRISLAAFALTVVTCAIVIALALSERRNRRLNRQLQDRNDTLRDLTSFVSHQLRAPVTAMRFTIETILDGDEGPVNDNLREPLQRLHDVATQNGKLIDDILNVSRIDRGVIEVKAEPVALKDIAERAMRDYHIPAQKAGLSLSLDGANSGLMVLADAEKMAEAVTNAISNAIKHTQKGGITLRLRADDRYGYIDVTDTGEGMTQDIMDKLFDRAGVKGANANSSASTGLGLFIARNFMQMQKGDITVTSTPGKGSTFSYKIPLA